MASKNVEVAVAGKQSHLQNWINDRSSNSHPSSHLELGFVTSFYQECRQTLAQIWDASQSQRTVVPKLQESLTRFVLWGSGWSEGRLDFCLNGSVELRNNVIELLSGLAKALLQICDSHPRQPKPVTQEHVRALIALREQARQFSVTVDNDSEASDSEGCLSDEEASTAEISVPGLWRRALENLEFHTKCLMDLLPSIEQTYKNVCDPGLGMEDGSGKISFQVTEAARPYVLQVLDKFENASVSLAERLGEANWQRFMRVRQHMAGELRGNDLEDLHVGARSTFFPASKFQDSGLGSSLRPEPSFALTDASHSSFVSNLSEKDGSRARVPATPNEVAEGISFECFICKRMLTKIKNRIDWKIHVFADLQPYICTFNSCRSMLVTFPNRKAWSEHELTQHRTHQSWKCHLCATMFTGETSLTEHLQQKHELPQHHCKPLAASSLTRSIGPLPATNERCPLCLQKGWPSRREFETHVGRHLEEIALSVLPRDVDSDSDQHSDAHETSNRGMSLPGSESQNPERSSSTKKHRCPYCATEFTRHYNLKSHLLTHSHEKPYICQTCQSRFRRLHDLKRHTKLHTGERPHICPKCGRKFARGDALARHNKGPGSCAGRRGSTGSFGGEDDYEGGNEGSMEGLYGEPEPMEEQKISIRPGNEAVGDSSPTSPRRKHGQRRAPSSTPSPVHEVETIKISKLDSTCRGKAERQRARTAEEDVRNERVQQLGRELVEMGAQVKSAFAAAMYRQQENELLDGAQQLAEREAAVLEWEPICELERGRERQRLRGSFSGTYDGLSIAKDTPGYDSQASQPDVFTSLNADLKAKPTLLKGHERQNHSAGPSRIVPTRLTVQYTLEQWAEKRDIITQLYAREGKSLREVKEYLRTKYSFRPTDRMYQRKLAQWDLLKKKYKASEMRAILRVARQRQAAGQESIFRIRGREVDIEEVVRYFKGRGEDPSTLDLPECAIPPTITVETPPPNLTLKHDTRALKPFGDLEDIPSQPLT
ncbi:hypothetical protein GJ744_004412 [Endocarpon pusillum]|uniref:C2H2-type domain-containing protein n=1 Tax=Endocarpon pusillum TaxID=364733 RepID=A0A8H7AWA8_9EURO|nr:hypothetical protein GJ744_004412 [Endocarpon pusillum]